jgi:hypothetical protein
MATKNLARTVVEGGRDTYSKLYRRLRNRSERRLRFDLEGDPMHGQQRLGGSRGFADRLMPLERWLGSNVGRGWSNVYHEFCERFDKRTMKGWHVRDHLLGMLGGGRFSWGGPFLVDDRGVLRRLPRARWTGRKRISPEEQARAMAWAAGRRVIVHTEAAFWTARVIDDPAPASPQGRRLTLDELAIWKALAPELQQELTYDAEAIRQRLVKGRKLQVRAR